MKCMQYMGEYGNYYLCEKPAKWMAPGGGLWGSNPRPVCGIHRRQIDAHYIRRGSDKRCAPIAP